MAKIRSAAVQVRQGDVLLTPIFNLDAATLASIRATDRNLLNAQGEAVLATGKGESHPHKVIGDVAFIETSNSKIMRQQAGDVVSRILVVGPKGASLVHDEHDTIELIADSIYVVFRQLETLVGDGNEAEKVHHTTGIIANDRQQPSRRYVED